MATAINIQNNMNLLDVAVATAGSLEDLFALAFANQVGITDNLVVGESLKTTGKIYKPSSTTLNVVRQTNEANVMSGQTLVDMAIQETGSVAGLFSLALLNNMSITHDLSQGQNLKYPTTAADRIVRKAFQDNDWHPASAKSLPGRNLPKTLSGIDYWAVEVDFVVQ